MVKHHPRRHPLQSPRGALAGRSLNRRGVLFTAPTSFANPAVAVARALTNTFSGICPVDLPGFVASELAGAAIGLMLMSWLLRGARGN